MTPEQVALVQASFAKVAPVADQAAQIFYDRLFERSRHRSAHSFRTTWESSAAS